MYDIALFLHLVGVVMLVIALSYTLGGLFRAQRATDVGGVRSALGFVPIAERIIPPAMILILACGLYMVGKGNWGWDTGWVDVAIAIFLLMSVLAFFLYNAASLAFGAAYNNLFLLYIVYFSLSLYAFILAGTQIELGGLLEQLAPRAPRSGIAILIFISGLSVFVWLE